MTDPNVAEVAAGRVVVDLRTPRTWEAKTYWRRRGGRVWMLIGVASPRVFAVGVEFIATDNGAKGLAIYVGPFGIIAVRAHLQESCHD